MADEIEIRLLRDDDPDVISRACQDVGWKKPLSQYQRYLSEQSVQKRICFVAMIDSQFAGYVTVNWYPKYVLFAEQNIPEIQDLNVLPKFRRKGIASRLLDRAEQEVARRSNAVGIGVGLHPGYNNAQRLYVKRGYIPDGRGVIYADRFVKEGEHVKFDDELVLHLTKDLRNAEKPS